MIQPQHVQYIHSTQGYTFPIQCISEVSKLKGFADNNFKFDKNSGNLSKRVEKNLRKGEIAHYEQFLLFPQCLQKT